jgi:hypothetical protein
VEEFSGEPGPAKGTTGALIRTHIRSINGLQDCLDFGLILMNAIPFQCSLGYSTSCFRDCVFRKVWNSGAKEIFVRRLNLYFREGDKVVNCCTKGCPSNGELELRALVQGAIQEAYPNVEPMRRTHPSSWWSQRNRQAQWKYKT